MVISWHHQGQRPLTNDDYADTGRMYIVMTMPAGPLGGVAGAERLLFTRGPRLGWTFRDRRQLIARYDEPKPDPQAIATRLAARRAKAQRAWSFAVKWVARPLLPLALVLYALGVLTGDATHHRQGGNLTALSITLAAVGLAWPAWCLVRLLYAQNWDPVRVHQAAVSGWHHRAQEHEQAELARIDGVPEWASAGSPGLRTDIYSGTLGGWQSLLAVHGASILAAQPLLVADFSGHLASRELTALARRHRVQGAIHMLPAGLSASGLLAGLTPAQFANALAEAIHAGSPGAATRADRAVDVRVLGHITSALGGNLTPARLAAAVQAALGQPVPNGLLSMNEAELIGADLFRDAYRAQVGPSLVRLDAYLADLARYTGPGAPQQARPCWYTCLALEPGGRSASAELLTALTVQWLTVQVAQSTATSPAVIVAGADEITRSHVEALVDACDRRGVPLTLLFRHLRDDATTIIGGAATTAFMRMGNHQEAEQAASFIGRQHTFTVSGWTATRGGEHSTSRTTGYSHGASQSRGYSSNRGWSGDGLAPWDRTASGGHTRSQDRGQSEEWSESDATSDGENWSTAQSVQRVYEFAVEPTVLQSLPGNALLLPPRGSGRGDMLAVECDPQIIMLPGAAVELAAAERASAVQPAAGQGDWPALAPPTQGPDWPHWQGPPAGNAPAGQPQPGPYWRRPRE
jgi:hypothetical protein